MMLRWAVPAVALLMLVLTLTPAEIWHAPAIDAVYKGFDANLMYANGGGSGRVIVSPASTKILAPPGAEPSLNLATTPMLKLVASVLVTVTRDDKADVPFRLGVWSPRAGAGYFIVFAPEGLLVVETFLYAGPAEPGQKVLSRKVFGSYLVGRPYRVTFLVDRVKGIVTGRVSSSDAAGTVEDSISSRDYPDLFSNVRLSVLATASAREGTSEVRLDDYSLTLPHERFWAAKIDDPKATAALLALGVAGLLLVAMAIATRVAAGIGSGLFRELGGGFPALLLRIRGRRRAVLLGAAAIGLYLVGNAALFPLGGHPFDMNAEKLYAYVARTYGVTDLYYLPNLVSLAKVWGGTPVLESGFPYEPVTAYLFAGIGWLNSLLFMGAGVFALDSNRLEYFIKATNVLFGLGDALLICWILRSINLGERWSLAGSALFLFNPAVWFNMSVWGQTHVISLFFVLAAVWFAEKDRPMWAWVALAAALLTRPQMVLFGLLLGIVLLRKFSWERNLVALSWTMILTFIALIPLTLAISPSLPVDVMRNNFHIQEAGGNGPSLTTVSQGAFSIWPLITYLAHGASGLQRTFMPGSQTLVGPLTYQLASQILTVSVLLLMSAALLVRKGNDFKSGGYVPIVALGIAASLMTLTSVVSTHFLLALPLLLLCRRWMSAGPYLFVALTWTVTSFVAMFGEMGAFLSIPDYPLLAPARNAVTKFFVELYLSDRFINVAVAANLCAVIWLAVLTFGHRVRPAGSLAAVSR